MSQFTNLQKANNPDHIYYDITLRNINSSNVDVQPLKFNETRSNPFVPNASEYVLSIVRFTLDTYSIPCFTADIEPNQANPNLMIQTISLEYDDNINPVISVVEPLIWTPNISFPVAPAPSTQPDGRQINSPYYYSFSYQHLIDICNTALATAMNNLIALVPALVGVPAPFMGWENNIATIYSRASHFNNTIFPRVNIYFNRAMYSIFNSFPTFRNNVNTTNGRIYRILTNPNFGKNLFTNPLIYGGAQTISIKQEYSTISNMQPCLQVVFVSNTLPIYPNQISTPTLIENGTIISSNNNSNFANIITDMSSFEQGMLPTVYYVPSAEYRRIDLQAVNTPLTNIDLSVFWRDKQGRLNEFMFPSGGSASIKLLFEKKHKLKKID